MEQYIQPFVRVTASVFKQMMKLDLKPGGVYFEGKESFLNWDISGLIALTGEVKGLIAISMKYPTAEKITDLLTGKERADMDETIDAIGEVVNIISGNVKKELEDLFHIIISLPKVIRGMAHTIVIPEDRIRLLCIPFTLFENETLCISINIEER